MEIIEERNEVGKIVNIASLLFPAGRWGNPEDLAGAVVFLSSKASDYLYGHILTVDGGWMAR